MAGQDGIWASATRRYARPDQDIATPEHSHAPA